jgi:hypothetical protein
MNLTKQWLFEVPLLLPKYGTHFNLESELEFPAPSSVRRAFENAVQIGDWRSAYLNLNGLSMYELLRALDTLAPQVLNTLWTNRVPFMSMVHMPRIDYARTVVINRKLPPPVGDLQRTGQVKDAATFIRERPFRTIDTQTELSSNFITTIYSLAFRNAGDINSYYMGKSGLDFVDWFNKEIAQRSYWKTRRIELRGKERESKARFNQIWNRIPEMFGTESINLLQFVCLMSIIINETGGNLSPVSERVGMPGHPGIAYAFNTISGTKASYNGGANKNAFELFNNQDFIIAHSGLPLGNRLSKTTDDRWAGRRYPIEDYPTSIDPKISGFILEADFFKFRGRGLIQTTFRSNYKRIIEHVKANTTNHPIVAEYRRRWINLSLDYIATTSTNRDWDRLFQETDYIIPAVAIRLHNLNSGKYLNLPLDATILNGKNAGSIYYAGLRVSGSVSYATLFRQRVLQILKE